MRGARDLGVNDLLGLLRQTEGNEGLSRVTLSRVTLSRILNGNYSACEHGNLYQADLARQLGVTQSYLSRLENDVEPLHKLAAAGEALGVSADFLLLLSDDPFPEATEAALPGAAAMAELEQLLVDAPDALRPGLVRFLIRMVGVYRETVGEG